MSSLPELETARLRLTLPGPEEAEAARAFFADNRAHLEPWEPPLAPDFFTLEYWRDRLERSRLEVEQDKSCRFMVRHRDDRTGPFVAIISFTNYSRGPHQACSLGYSISAAEQGKGLMREALVAAIAWAFGPLGM